MDSKQKKSRHFIDGKSILITGGTGSFGQKFIETVLQTHNPTKIVVFSRDELKQYEMQQNDIFAKNQKKMRYFLGDIRDRERLQLAMNSGVDYVIHTAALKQVPALEYNPFEAVKTNILGSENVIATSMAANVRKVLALGTDKAVAPINLYGATKLVSDKLFQAANNYTGESKTIFSVVRYGNVMGSRGSVIPYFLEARKSGTLRITDSRMTRFNITLQQGVDFVFECLKRMIGGELFIPKIPSYRVLDVAAAIAPGVRLKEIGIRSGEKMHEEMITITDSRYTVEYDQYYVMFPSTGPIRGSLAEIVKTGDGNLLRDRYPNGYSYSSNSNEQFLTVDEIRELIIENVSGGHALKATK